MESNQHQLQRQKRDKAGKKQCQEHVDIKRWKELSFKLIDATRKVTITKDGWVPPIGSSKENRKRSKDTEMGGTKFVMQMIVDRFGD